VSSCAQTICVNRSNRHDPVPLIGNRGLIPLSRSSRTKDDSIGEESKISTRVTKTARDQ
jgi:hypothetical protein